MCSHHRRLQALRVRVHTSVSSPVPDRDHVQAQRARGGYVKSSAAGLNPTSESSRGFPCCLGCGSQRDGHRNRRRMIRREPPQPPGARLLRPDHVRQPRVPRHPLRCGVAQGRKREGRVALAGTFHAGGRPADHAQFQLDGGACPNPTHEINYQWGCGEVKGNCRSGSARLMEGGHSPAGRPQIRLYQQPAMLNGG